MDLSHRQPNRPSPPAVNAFTASVEANLLFASVKGSVSAPATKRGIDVLRMICLTVLALAGMACGTYAYTHHPVAAALTQPTEQRIELVPAALTSARLQNSPPRFQRTPRTQRKAR